MLATKVYNSRDQLAERGSPVGARHPPGVRRQPPSAADRLHRPLPDAPRRPRHAVGRDLAGDGRARAAGQGALRRQQQLRRAGTSCRPTRRAARRGSLGLVSEQSLYNLNARTIELEVLPACEHYGVGMIPWSPLGGGLLGGVLADRAAGGRRGNAAGPGPDRGPAPAARAVGEALRRARVTRPPTSRSAWLLHQPGRHRADHRAAHASSSSTPRWARSTCSSTPTCWRASTRSSPARAVPRPRRTPGRRDA